VVGQVGQRERAALLEAVGAKARVGIDVAPQRDDALALVQQALGEPAAEEALRPCYEDAQEPPATAGRIVTSSPSSTDVSRPSRKRMSSPPT
jgi:hypothetical protein